jgi:hypothetical protein
MKNSTELALEFFLSMHFQGFCRDQGQKSLPQILQWWQVMFPPQPQLLEVHGTLGAKDIFNSSLIEMFKKMVTYIACKNF